MCGLNAQGQWTRADDQVARGFSSVRAADLSAALKCASVKVQSHSW